jgi:rhodanese-related sulfurtransferase
MPKNRKSTRKTSSQSSTGALLRRPLVQIGIVAVVALVIYFLLSTSSGARGGLPANVSVDEAYTLIRDGAFMLDVRELVEWNEFHAPVATLIPLGELAARLNELPRDRKIVVVCRSGNRSQQGRDILLAAGFTQVTSTNGGMNAWRTSGYPIEP